MNKIQILLSVVALIIVIGWAVIFRDSIFTRPQATADGQKLVASFLCKDSKSVIATFSEKAVALTLSDGRTTSLSIARSASGARYANADESFVFWNKGNTAFITEGLAAASKETFSGCVVASAAPAGWQGYLASDSAFTLSHPAGYSVKDPFTYSALGPGKDIKGTAFIIPAEATKGTNLSNDTLISVETIPGVEKCDASLFLPNVKTLGNLVDKDVTYSVATSSDAGAGNFYDEVVYAMPGTSPCTAVRYFVHFTNIANYPKGTVVEFDRNTLFAAFDAIRRTLVLGR